MVSLQNELHENLIENKQVCGVNTRGGASTQDPDYPENHPKRKEQEALKKKSFVGKSPNENKDIDDSQEQDKDISISDAETEDDNIEKEESSPPEGEQHEAENTEEPKPTEKEDPQSSTEKNKKKKHPNNQKGKDRDPWVQRPIPYPQEVMISLDDAKFEKFLELIKTLCLQIPLVDAIKIPPYSKYMEDIGKKYVYCLS